MGRRRISGRDQMSQTLPSSPTHSFSSSSSSDFEFTIALSPRKSSSNLCPADELFYKGQLLPLHLSPRLSMVRTLLLASSSTSSSSDTTTTASRDSTGSSNDSHSSFSSDCLLLPDSSCDSSRPSSVADDIADLNNHHSFFHGVGGASGSTLKKSSKYFSLSRLSSVFRKESKTRTHHHQNPDPLSAGGPSSAAASTAPAASSVKRMSVTAKEVIRKYFKKVKPLYEKLSQNQKQQQQQASKMTKISTNPLATTFATRISNSADVTLCNIKERSSNYFYDFSSSSAAAATAQNGRKENNAAAISHSFSGNLRYPRSRRNSVSSCPSSMRSSPSHSGILSRNYINGFPPPATTSKAGNASDFSSMEELQNAIQGAIAHCKNSMIQSNNNHTDYNKSVVSNEI